VCTITLAALQKHLSAWKKGHSPFFGHDLVEPPRALCLQNVLHLHGFHGTAAGHSFIVLLHLRLGHAVYPVRCVLMDKAPDDIVLGLCFRRRYDTAVPPDFKPHGGPPHGQGLGATHVCLGIPPGFGVSFPNRKLQDSFAPASPSEVPFKRVPAVHQSWQN
jgi:hypothetical protein